MDHLVTVAPWVLVCGGFHRRGGMDRANLALAEALLAQGRHVHLVGHDFDVALLDNPNVTIARVPRPAGVLMSENALRRRGLKVAAKVAKRWPGARVVVNGGNCPWPDINWAHSVHAAWPRFDAEAPLWFRAKSRVNKQKARRDELLALRRARVVIANSERTRRDVEALGIPATKIRVIYLGCEREWQPPSPEERVKARQGLGIATGMRVVSFVGGLGYDRNKGFDTLLAAWREARFHNSLLIAAGAGRGFAQWRREIEKFGLHGHVRLLGFTDRVGELLAASDLFVSPVRYEAFGLNVLEALCRGVPSVVSKNAGVAELYPPELSKWLLESPEDAVALAECLRRGTAESAPTEFAAFGARLRGYTMREMAENIIAAAER